MTSAALRCRPTETGQGHATSAAQRHQLLCKDVQAGLLSLEGQQQAPVKSRPAPGAGCKAHAGDQPPSPSAAPHQARATPAAASAGGQPAPEERPGTSRGNQVAASQLSPTLGVLLACPEHLSLPHQQTGYITISSSICTGGLHQMHILVQHLCRKHQVQCQHASTQHCITAASSAKAVPRLSGSHMFACQAGVRCSHRLLKTER